MIDRPHRLEQLIARIGPADERARRAAQQGFDAKTKPRGSLGRLEQIGCRMAAIGGSVPEHLRPAVVVAAADHGVAAEGVSAYPQEVTAQMLANFAAGGAAINVLARQADARLVVVDVGIAVLFEHELVRSVRIGAGTANLTDGPAMTGEQALRALLAGAELAEQLAADGVNAVALGEMGIANTTAASTLAAALLTADPGEVCGRGTGLDDAGVTHASVASAMSSPALGPTIPYRCSLPLAVSRSPSWPVLPSAAPQPASRSCSTGSSPAPQPWSPRNWRRTRSRR